MTNDSIDTWSEDSKEYMPGDQAWYTHFRIGRVAPERYEGSQFPEGEEAQDQFFRIQAALIWKQMLLLWMKLCKTLKI